jgi:hypothetical protein
MLVTNSRLNVDLLNRTFPQYLSVPKETSSGKTLSAI